MLRLSTTSIKLSTRQLSLRSLFKRHSSDHHAPLGPEENMFNGYLVTPVLLTIGGLALYKVNDSYKKSHNGETLVDLFIGHSYESEVLVENFKNYQSNVLDEKKLYELISFTPKHDKDHYPLHIDGVPGQHFPYNAASNFSVTVDFDNLEKRREPFNSLK